VARVGGEIGRGAVETRSVEEDVDRIGIARRGKRLRPERHGGRHRGQGTEEHSSHGVDSMMWVDHEY
jgi:hypothetical protein